MHPAAVDLTKVQCTTQSFSVDVDVILYKQNWEFKKVETEKKRLTNEPPLPLYRKKKHLTEATETNTCWSDRRPTGPTALLLVLHITTSQTIHYICTSFFCVSHGLRTRVPFPKSTNPVFAFSILHISPPPSWPCPSLQSPPFTRPPQLIFVNLFTTVANELKTEESVRIGGVHAHAWLLLSLSHFCCVSKESNILDFLYTSGPADLLR